MATKLSEVLTSAGMKLTIFCGGQSYVGVRLAGTWAGTIYFEASTDGVTFNQVSVTPFASGTDVQSSTANGNWFIAVQNYVAFRARVYAYTSGSVQVFLATSTDASYQDAFLASTSLYVSSSATSGTNTLTQAAQTNRAWKLKTLECSVAGPSWSGGTVTVTVYDGSSSGNVLWQEFLDEVSGSVGRRYNIHLPADGVVGTPGNAMTIILFGIGSTNASKINAEFTAA